MANRSFILRTTFFLCVIALFTSTTTGHGTTPGHQAAHRALQGKRAAVRPRDFEGFQVYTDEALNGMVTRYSPACRSALTQIVACDAHVESLARLDYHGSLGNDTLTDLVCDAGCLSSLQSWFGDVETACDGSTLDDGTPPSLPGGRMIQGRAETCLQDSATGRYCNDIISEFTPVTSITEMPTSEICSECYVDRHALMQESPYSAYDEFHKGRLEYIYSRCGITGDTSIPTSLIPPVEHNVPCITTTYTTVAGDTCDSLAQANSFASASLFIGNTDKIIDCGDLGAGLELCLPFGCDDIYTLQDGDTCGSIEESQLLQDGTVRKYNSWVSASCDNLLGASDDAYGHVICLSPQGGVSETQPPSWGGALPGGGTGYGTEFVDVPAGATKAPGSTRECSSWYTAQDGDQCVHIAVSGPTTLDLLMEVNPSLGTAAQGCDGNVVIGLAYCALPRIGWNWTIEATEWPSDLPTTSTTVLPSATASSEPSTTSPGNGVTTPTPIQDGMTDSCNDFYFVHSGDGCAAIASAHDIALSDFYAWNPAVGSNCGGLWADVYVCVGVIDEGPGNGIATPTPTQEGMTGNCDAFYFVEAGDGCADIASAHGISLAAFYAWNPAVGSSCGGLWAEVYVCVGVLDEQPTTTAPGGGNGISTPTPTQAGMAPNCDEFHLVVVGDGCWAIANDAGVNLQDFYAWNPAVGTGCEGLWPDYYVCISLI